MSECEEERTWGRVLSIQSHCVHSIVGNRSAVFPLQLLGFEVDPINSVQFSNHTGYPNGFKGQVLGGKELGDLVAGLEMNNIVSGYSHLLTGFIGSESFLETVIGVYDTLKRANPDLCYVCDPVLGDKGRLYVPKELVQVYRTKVVPKAAVLTPNQFELELLTDIKIADLDTLKNAFAVLHGQGVQSVFLTSSEFQAKENSLSLFASVVESKPSECGGQQQRQEEASVLMYEATIPKIDGHFTGTGDLIAALLLAWTTRCPGDFEKAIMMACTSMFGVVSRTKASIDRGENPNKEIRLVQSRRVIERPDIGQSPIVVRKL